MRSAEKEKASVLISEIKESLEEGKSEGMQRRDESNGLDRRGEWCDRSQEEFTEDI